ncbi:Putative LOC100877332, partial [Caligus rogercresseyi]
MMILCLSEYPEELSPYYFSIKKEKEAVEGLLKSRIVITTCTSSSFFARIRDFRRFTHVFIDEAGFVLEPDILTPLNFLEVKEGQIVLAGDAQQLSPVLTSSIAKEHGLGISLIERLCTHNPLYAPDPQKFVTRFADSYDSLLITKLVRNYRNHAAILQLPSKLFYHDELIPCRTSHHASFQGHDILVNEDFPIVYHALEGEQVRDEDSPSWYNRQEAFQDSGYVPEDIGIITPYRKQVDCIRNYITSFDLPMPK